MAIGERGSAGRRGESGGGGEEEKGVGRAGWAEGRRSRDQIGSPRYKNWPWRLLRPGLVDSVNFMQAHPCCLDSWFSEPLRSTLSAAADLETAECKALFKNLGRKHLKVLLSKR